MSRRRGWLVDSAVVPVGRVCEWSPASDPSTAGLADAAELAAPSAGPRVGVIAGNDWLALGLHTALMTRGPRVRERVEIVTFDGLPITADPSLRIRSLAAPIDAMATDAVAELRRLAAAPVACGRDISYPLS